MVLNIKCVIFYYFIRCSHYMFRFLIHLMHAVQKNVLKSVFFFPIRSDRCTVAATKKQHYTEFKTPLLSCSVIFSYLTLAV